MNVAIYLMIRTYTRKHINIDKNENHKIFYDQFQMIANYDAKKAVLNFKMQYFIHRKTKNSHFTYGRELKIT